jgi:hypothetical protein
MKPGNTISDEVARNRKTSARAGRASISAVRWAMRAGAIWLAMKRRQIRS